MKILAESTLTPEAHIAHDAQRLLRKSPYYFLKRLDCRYAAGVLTLEGRVPDGRLKQFAESIVERVEGVLAVVNRIEVCDPSRDFVTARAVRNAG